MARIQNKIAWGLVGALALLVVAALAGVVQGGPLDPPGPPASTQRTQVTSLPFTISARGSYVVMADLSLAAGNGISVNADNVDIDLNGFSLNGGAGTDGIVLVGPQTGVVVHDGTVRGWGDEGIDFLDGGLCTSCRVENVQALSNTGEGIRLGTGSIVRHNTASGNGVHGIVVAGGGSIRNYIVDNLATNNAQIGIAVLSADNLVARNFAGGNPAANYSIAAGNAAGPTEGMGVALSNPWANIEE